MSIKETAGEKIIASTWGGSLLIYNEAGGKFEKMRTRIATDMHDDIGATLGSIAMGLQ